MHHFIKLPFLLFVLLIAIAIIWVGGPDEQLEGLVWTHRAHVPVDSTSVILLSPKLSPIDSMVTDAFGKFQFSVKEYKECKLRIQKSGYQTRTVDISAELNSNQADLVRIEIHPVAASLPTHADDKTIFDQ